MWVAPCSWRTRINLILESTSASKIGIAAPPDSPNMYSTPSRSRQRISFSAPVVALRSAGVADEAFFEGLLAGVEAGAGLCSELGTATPCSKSKKEGSAMRPTKLGRFAVLVNGILAVNLMPWPKWAILTQCSVTWPARSGRFDRDPQGFARDVGVEGAPGLLGQHLEPGGRQRVANLVVGEAAF